MSMASKAQFRIIAYLVGFGLIGAAATEASGQPPAAAQAPSAPAARIEQLRWLAGHWVGRGLGGQSTETISPPLAGQMSGHFQQTSANGDIQFFEFYQFIEVNGSLLLRIRHFNPDLTSWEALRPEEFRLTSISANEVQFGGVIFRRAGSDRLIAEVVTRRGSTQSRITFEFERQQLGSNN